jgi:hypothetical protein
MTYRILSLDGGGTWALIEVKALLDIFGDLNGHAVLSHFDMAVANSGGSIVLGGLLEDKPLSMILQYFMDDNLRRSIFQPTTMFFDAVLRGILHFGPQYSSEKKLPSLQRLLPVSGGQTLTNVATSIPGAHSGAPVHILMTGFDYDRNVASFFRSAPTGGAEWGNGSASDDVTLAEAIHASSNAPVQFFDAPASWDGGNRYWDGAIAGCNNPVLAGVTEAITLGNAPADIRALSLGTATVRSPGPPQDNPPPFIQARGMQDFPNDLVKLAGSITDDPPDVASFIAHVMTGGPQGLASGMPSRIVRLNPMVSPVLNSTGAWAAPGNWTKEQLNRLAGVDLAALDPIDLAYIADYADLWLQGSAPNQPLRMDSDTLQSKLGPMDARAAIANWNAIA